MIVFAYIVAVIVCFIATVIANLIPLTLMHGMAGNQGSMWEPDQGNETRFHMVHNWGQGTGALLRMIAGMSAALWVFTWFEKDPNVIFFAIIGLFGVVISVANKPSLMTIAQLTGSVVGLIIFFSQIW